MMQVEESFEVVIEAIERLEPRTGHAFRPLSSAGCADRAVHILDIIRQNIVDLHYLPQQLLRLLPDLLAAVRSQYLNHGVVDQPRALLVVVAVEGVAVCDGGGFVFFFDLVDVAGVLAVG